MYAAAYVNTHTSTHGVFQLGKDSKATKMFRTSE